MPLQRRPATPPRSRQSDGSTRNPINPTQNPTNPRSDNALTTSTSVLTLKMNSTTHRRADGCGCPTQQAIGNQRQTVKANKQEKRATASARRAPFLRPNDLWRRPAPARESGERLVGSVMKRILDHVPVAVETCPTAAIRAKRCEPAPKGRVSMRESGRRLPSFVTRGRLQREAVESGTMDGGKLRRAYPPFRFEGDTGDARPSSGPVVWRHGQRLVREASCPTSRKRGDVKSPLSHSEGGAKERSEFRGGCPKHPVSDNPGCRPD